MSHSVVVVCFSPDENGVIDFDQLEEKLAPFDENQEVEPYQRECWCVGHQARRESRDAAWAELGYNLDQLRENYHKLDEAIRSDTIWAAMIAPFEALQAQKLEAHALKESADPECTDCEGTGTYESTYNPQSRWDWYVVGGRWSGYLAEKEIPLYSSPDYKGDAALATDIATGIANGTKFFAILTPDGQWHEKGKMGWWGMVSNEKDPSDWDQESQDLLNKLPLGSVGLLVDVHI